MDKLLNLDSDIGLARTFPVSVLITAPPDSAMKIVHAIAEGHGRPIPGLVMFDGAALVDLANWRRRERGATDDEADLVIREVHALSEAEQAALMKLLETAYAIGRRRIIATSSASVFDRVEQGTFMAALFYRLNIVHIVSDPCNEGRGASPRPIIAA
jgi:hypothetical protein